MTTSTKTPPVERAASRRKLAKKGQALPDGSFPIPNVAYLKKAIQAFGRAKNKPRAKAHIIASARRLGRADLIPSGWSSGGSPPKKKAIKATGQSGTVIVLARKSGHSSAIHPSYSFVGRAPGASGSNRPFDETKYLRGVGGKFASKFSPAEMIAGHRIVEAGIINLQVGETYKLPSGGGWVQRSAGGYLVQGPAGLRVAFRTASEAVQAAANIMIGQLHRVGEPKKQLG